MISKSESDMDLEILVERKKILIIFLSVISILTQLCDFFLFCFDLFLNERFSDVTLDRA